MLNACNNHTFPNIEKWEKKVIIFQAWLTNYFQNICSVIDTLAYLLYHWLQSCGVLALVPILLHSFFQNNFAFSSQEIRVWNMRKSQIPKPGPFQIPWWVWGFYFIYSFVETGSFEGKSWAILIFVPFWTDIMVQKRKECTVKPGVGRRSWQKDD